MIVLFDMIHKTKDVKQSLLFVEDSIYCLNCKYFAIAEVPVEKMTERKKYLFLFLIVFLYVQVNLKGYIYDTVFIVKIIPNNEDSNNEIAVD